MRTDRTIRNRLDAILACNLVLIALVLICLICLVAWELRLRRFQEGFEQPQRALRGALSHRDPVGGPAAQLDQIAPPPITVGAGLAVQLDQLVPPIGAGHHVTAISDHGPADAVHRPDLDRPAIEKTALGAFPRHGAFTTQLLLDPSHVPKL